MLSKYGEAIDCGWCSSSIKKAKNLTSATGARQLILETGAENTPSHALYESLGFERDDFCCTNTVEM